MDLNDTYCKTFTRQNNIKKLLYSSSYCIIARSTKRNSNTIKSG